jgi:RNA polymerase sigma-70 factor (ECF subfamily)
MMSESGARSVSRVGIEQTARLAKFVRLTERCDRDVRAVCRRCGIRLGDVDDVVQRVFMTIYAKLDCIEPGAERAFVVAVARHEVGHLRRTYARRAEVDDLTLAPRSSGAVRLDERLHQQRSLADVDRALARMPASLSRAWRMYELEGLSCARIAGVLDVPLGTVKTRLRRARQWLALAMNGASADRKLRQD